MLMSLSKIEPHCNPLCWATVAYSKYIQEIFYVYFFDIQNFKYVDLGYYIHFLDKIKYFCKVWWLRSTIVLVCRMTWYFLLPIVKEFLSKWIETNLSNKVVSELYEYNTLTNYQIQCGWYIHICGCSFFKKEKKQRWIPILLQPN